jgi:hypothetical protein
MPSSAAASRRRGTGLWGVGLSSPQTGIAWGISARRSSAVGCDARPPDRPARTSLTAERCGQRAAGSVASIRVTSVSSVAGHSGRAPAQRVRRAAQVPLLHLVHRPTVGGHSREHLVGERAQRVLV